MCLGGIFRKWTTRASAQEKQPLATLWHAEVRCVQDFVLLDNTVAVRTELVHDFPQEIFVFADRQAANVFKHEIAGMKIDHQAHEMIHKRISGIVEGPLPDHAEPLARRTAKDHIYRGVSDPGHAANVRGVDVRDAATNGCAGGEIELVHGPVDRIVFDGGGYIEASLLKPETHPARAREQIHSKRSASFSHQWFPIAYFTTCSAPS
jgi:hypothetical protein